MSVRLVNYWVPKHYGLDLCVSLVDWNTFGTEVVSLEAPAGAQQVPFTDKFTLHAGTAINITSLGEVFYTTSGNTDEQPLAGGVTLLERCDAKQTVHLQFNGLPGDASKVRFTVKFQNPINPELRGLYQCTYKESVAAASAVSVADSSSNNNTAQQQQQLVERRMASTHFEPVGARLMYLCVDEPAVRVAFSMTCRLPSDLAEYTVLSNGPVLSKAVLSAEDTKEEAIAPDAAYAVTQTKFPIVYRFQKVTAIPTYLTCLVVGDLEYIESLTAEGEVNPTPIRFYTVKGKSRKAQYGLDVARFSLHYFEKFFKSKFPMPKLDLVAVPDFPIGGMENWGCICLTETCLMPYEKESDNSVAKLKGVCNLVTHEVSHNWFGNLVGIDWWDGLWLKEGFATWCGIQGTIAFRPQLREDHSFYGEMNEALAVDGFAGSHPIETRIDDPADITQVFDAISYDKGMSVCNMLQAYLGAELFSVGLANYINQYAYKNTTTQQLWRSIEEATKMPVVDVMESFTNQKGFPLVSVGLKKESAAGSAAIDFTKPLDLTVSQEKFAYLGCPEHLPDALWRVPLRIVVVDTKKSGDEAIVVDHRAVLGEKSATITIPAIAADKLSTISGAENLALVVNPGGAGFYRVLYTDNVLSTALLQRYADLPELYRRSVLNDLVSVYMCGKKDLSQVVELLTASITSEESFAIFHDALEGASFLQGTLSCGCGKHGKEDAGTAAATSATADAAATIATELRAVVSQRCESIAADLYLPSAARVAANQAALTPEEKMMRTYALGNAFSDRKKKLLLAAAAATTADASSDDTNASWRRDDVLLKWASERVKEFYGEAPSVPAYTITDPDTISMCLAIPLVTDTAPEYPEFAKLLAVYPHVEAAPEKAIAVLNALCANGQNMPGLQLLFKNCTRNNGIRSMWGSIVVAALCRNKTFSKNFLWSHWREDWSAIFNQWGKSQFRIQRMIGALAHNCASLNTAEAAEEWKTFFAANPCPAAKLDIERGYEMILLRSMLKEKDGAKFSSSEKEKQ